MEIAVTPLDTADNGAVDEAHQVIEAARAADLPDFPPQTRRALGAMFQYPWPGNDHRHALARVDGVAAGYLEISLPMLDNLDNAEVELVVHPRFRRRGVGRALFEYAASVVRDLGRKRFSGMAVEALPGGVARDPAGAAFGAAMGAQPALLEVRRRLDVTQLDERALDEQLADAWRKADGYSLVRWRETAPDEYVDDIAYLDGRLLTDAPLGDLGWEGENIDAARIRATERVIQARGKRRYNIGVRHDESGRLVAFTTLDTSDIEWHAFQQITLVEPKHRGHRLGTIVKIENLRFMREHEPSVRMIDTWNAGVNDHMIRINEAMGFRPVEGWQNWQIAV